MPPIPSPAVAPASASNGSGRRWRRPPAPAVPTLDHGPIRLALARWPEPSVQDRRDQLHGLIFDLVADAVSACRAGRDNTAELLGRIGQISRGAIPG